MVRLTSPRLITVNTYQTTLEGHPLLYTVKRSHRAKYVRLEVRVESGLTVVVPRSHKLEQIPHLLQEKRRWILGKLKDYRQFQSISSETSTDTISYLGQALKVVKQRNHSQADNVSLERNRLMVSLRPISTLNQVLEEWYRHQAVKLIRERVKKLSTQLGVTYRRLSIHTARTRWGSCSRKGNLNFNWKLIMAPEPVIDYVIIHELTHLIEMTHSKKFWSLVEEYCPKWREHKEWLRNHQAELATKLRLEVD